VVEVPEDVAHRLVQHLPVPVGTGDLPGVEVDPGEQGLVVEHLLEVGHQPRRIDAVAGEAPAHVVVDAPRGHGVERRLDGAAHLGLHAGSVSCVAGRQRAQQHVEAHRLRELRRAAEATARGVVLLEEVADDLRQRVRPGRRLPGVEERRAPQRAGELTGLRVDVVPPGAPQLVDAAAQVGERDHAAPLLAREVRAAEERSPVRGEEDGHGPAAVAVEGVDGLHVDLVDVRPLLAVDLDVDEQVVHQACDGLVLERLVGHHVAPVARRVADGQQDRPVGGPGGRERLVAPRVPVDRVVGVLAQVGAGLVGQAVHASTVGGRRGDPCALGAAGAAPRVR
jgi:hypothetical protein